MTPSRQKFRACNMLAFCILMSKAMVSRAEMEGFIIGGSFTSINKFPHAAFLMIECKNLQNSSYFGCGSSILNQKIVLTAAHCINICNSRTRISINFGHEQRNNGTLRSAKKFVWHESYDPHTLAYDIGMVMISRSVKFGENIARVAIMRNPPYRERGMVAGWGITNGQTPKLSILLKKLDEEMLSRKNCIMQLGFSPRGTICAKSKIQSHHIATGDSGSGLVVRGYIQIGLVSGYKPLARDIGIYTDVGFFYDWIKQNAHDLYCS